MEQKLERIGSVTVNTTYQTQDVYNDGDDVEEDILRIVQEGRNNRALIEQDTRWPVLYHLSPSREVITLPMDIRPGDQVLEIGAGMGAVTGGLLNRAGTVDCVEISPRRAAVNAWRHRDCSNLNIYVGNYQTLPLKTESYDVATLIGVLEYAPSFIQNTEHPAEQLLHIVFSHLKPKGRLYIAIENRLGIKYFAGCLEDHLGRSFAGITGYTQNDWAQTFSRSELKELVTHAGFEQPYFYYPLPDYKFPSHIFSDDILGSNKIPLVQNYDAPRLRYFNEQDSLRSLVGTEEFGVFANSFLLEVIKP